MLTCWALMFPELFREPLGCRPSHGLGNVTPTTLRYEASPHPSADPSHVDRQDSAGLEAVLLLMKHLADFKRSCSL